MTREDQGRPVVYTVGHAHRTLDEFIVLLIQAGVAQVVDVRRYPGSRRWPWFRRQALQHGLVQRGITYHWLGKWLGGFTQPPYPEYMVTETFREGLDRVMKLARISPTALLCAEKDWRRCHRRFIAQALVERGWEVVHLVDFGVQEPHPQGAAQLPLPW